MLKPHSRHVLMASLTMAVTWAVLVPETLDAQDRRGMTFLDLQHMRNAGGVTPSPDGRWALYTISTPDWEDDNRQSDIYLVSTEQGLSSTKQMTYTEDKNETSPTWAPDGSFFLFLSNRDAAAGAARAGGGGGGGGGGFGGGGGAGMQLYMMRPDGGEARKITSARAGISNYEFSPDGRILVYRSGRNAESQLYSLPANELLTAEPTKISTHEMGVGNWEFSPDSRTIYFDSPDSIDTKNNLRREKGFTVDIKNQETPLEHLWALTIASRESRRLTSDASYTVRGFNISEDGKWIGFSGTSSARYERNITEQGINTDLYLLEVATGNIERLTNNKEVGEQGPVFSPDGRWVAFGGPDNLERYTMDSRRVYIREVANRGGSFRKLGGKFHDHVGLGFWSEDGNTIYFNTGVRATRQLMALDIRRDEVTQVTSVDASLSVDKDDDSGLFLINYSDPKTPSTTFAIRSIDQVRNRNSWVQLTDANPQVRSSFLLGDEEEITWRSTDGKDVSGVLVRPVGFRQGQRYPLIVAIHGGPASADVLGFNGGYGAQVYAGAGYAVLRPNYRGSTNYGEEHRISIVGDYFPQAFDDIMTGVDYLIDQGIVDGDRMGVLGWSAGGHWSNWILTHTDRFKAISSGAGTSNWISMYGQSDVQRNRQFYLGDDMYYDNHEAYWDQSPLKYIKNAKTPTMIHVVEGDPRVPSPQSVELHMGLKKVGVATELFMYPGRSHGIPDARNRLLKSVSEMSWMDYYVRGIGDKFNWDDVLKTLESAEATPRPRATTEEDSSSQ